MSKVPYANAIRCLMYLMVCTRHDISHAVNVVSRYMVDPSKEHWNAIKWIFRYLTALMILVSNLIRELVQKLWVMWIPTMQGTLILESP